jgi:hypothetical protein
MSEPTDPNQASASDHLVGDAQFTDPELDGSNAAIAREMREVAEATQRNDADDPV